MPQGPSLGCFVEAQELLDSTVAVGGDNKDLAREICIGSIHAQNNVVVKLALFPMLKERVPAVSAAQHAEKSR